MILDEGLPGRKGVLSIEQQKMGRGLGGTKKRTVNQTPAGAGWPVEPVGTGNCAVVSTAKRGRWCVGGHKI